MTIAQLFADPIDTLAESTGLMDAFGRIAYLLLLIGGLWAFNATKGHRCMCGGLSMFGVLFLPCAAFLDLVLVRCATAFSFREFIRDETINTRRHAGSAPCWRGPFEARVSLEIRWTPRHWRGAIVQTGGEPRRGSVEATRIHISCCCMGFLP